MEEQEAQPTQLRTNTTTNTHDTNTGGWGLYSVLRHHNISTALSFPQRMIFRSDDTVDGDSDYSNLVILLDMIWNMAFVLVAVAVLFLSSHETPSTPLRLWLSGYAFHCFFHVLVLCLQSPRRKNTTTPHHHHHHDYDNLAAADGLSFALTHISRIMKRLESINTIISPIWWVVGFYWIVSGGRALLQDSPCLYWSTVVFLAFDVFFIIFCIGVAFVIFLAIFCCIPILAIAYAVAIRKGASENDISRLPKYRYHQDSPLRKLDDNDKKQEVLGARVGSSNNDELALLLEDSECCICLSRYVDGVELYALPCNHYFHCRCISKWLRINATCPLCKFDIRRGDTMV